MSRLTTGIHRKVVRRLHPNGRWREAVLIACGVAGLMGLGACGSGSGTSAGEGSLNLQPVWQQPGGTEENAQLPAAVQTVRIWVESDTGMQCCVAVDPTAVPIDSTSGQRLLVLTDLPPGAAQLMMAAFAADFAPAPDGEIAICATDPAGIGQACDPSRAASPSFESSTETITIVAGTLAEPVDLTLHALPFLLDLQPEPGASAASPIPVSFTAADAATGIDQGSIVVEASFRSLSKRVALTSTPCDDATETDCSPGGALRVTGYKVIGSGLFLPAGPASLRIVAQNLASPPGQLDFSYDFTVLPGAESGAAAGSSTGSIAKADGTIRLARQLAAEIRP